MLIKLLMLLHLLLVVVLTLRVLWRHDLTPVARLAWFIVLLILPYAGVVVYWMFGEVDLGFDADSERQKIITRLHEYYPTALGDTESLANEVCEQYHATFSYATSVNGFHTTTGNQVTLMPDADTTLAHMIADFDAATQHIHVLYYIWLNDKTGTAVANALMRAAQRGVTCRVMVDGLGSRHLLSTDLWSQMQAAGVQVAVALPLKRIIRTLLFSRIDLRNHRKITLIDGRVTYCGSQNCADPEFAIKATYAPWVDIMLRLEGPVVAQNQLLFASDWLVACPDTPLSAFRTIHRKHANGVIAQVFADGPSERRAATPQLFSTLIAQAQTTLMITTPYFVPDYSVINAICAAAYRGVSVTMVFPKRNDSFVVAATSRSYYRQLLEAGVQIYEFREGLLHAKTLTMDGTISFIGSSNIDLRSFDLNYENNLLLSDKSLAQAIITRQQYYISRADKIHLSDVMQWSPPKQIWYNIIATIGPIL